MYKLGRRSICQLLLSALLGSAACLAQDALPPVSHEARPASGKGPLIVLFSGGDGYRSYVDEAGRFAKEGYVVVLIDSTLFFNYTESKGQTTGTIKGLIERSLQKPEVQSKKAAVVGYSRGGHLALFYANRMPEQVSAVVAYYPETRLVTEANVREVLSAPRVEVPTLILTGAMDSYKNCCVIAKARLVHRTAALPDITVPVDLHEYPNAGHVFNIPRYADNYRSGDADDAFWRSLSHIRKFAGDP